MKVLIVGLPLLLLWQALPAMADPITIPADDPPTLSLTSLQVCDDAQQPALDLTAYPAPIELLKFSYTSTYVLLPYSFVIPRQDRPP